MEIALAPYLLVAAGLLALLAGARSSTAEPPAAPAEIAWQRKLAEAYDLAKKEDKPLFIAINSERVDGGRVEPAGKELREVTYKDPRVVESAKRFVCAYLTAEGSSDDFGELRARYAIEGLIVSPQHIFAAPDGSLLLPRLEYWTYGYGEKAVVALLDLLERAWKKDRARRGMPEAPSPSSAIPPAPGSAPGAPGAPADPGARARWIAEVVTLIVTTSDPDTRKEALTRLLQDDKDGAGVAALLLRFPEMKKDAGAVADVARALGRPGLEAAVPTLVELLDHRDGSVRGNAAVSLEYVGSKTAVEGLTKAVGREKDVSIANHLYRALGRCAAGSEDVDRTRDLLTHRAQGAKSEDASYGPIIGLAYFEKDAKTAREVEKLIQKEGLGSAGRRGGGQGALKGPLMVWTLTEIGDPKSEKFIREKLLPEVNENDPWAGVRILFLKSAAKAIGGDEAAKGDVQTGVTRLLAWVVASGLDDEARRGREDVPFVPKADWLRKPRAPTK